MRPEVCVLFFTLKNQFVKKIKTHIYCCILGKLPKKKMQGPSLPFWLTRQRRASTPPPPAAQRRRQRVRALRAYTPDSPPRYKQRSRSRSPSIPIRRQQFPAQHFIANWNDSDAEATTEDDDAVIILDLTQRRRPQRPRRRRQAFWDDDEPVGPACVRPSLFFEHSFLQSIEPDFSPTPHPRSFSPAPHPRSFSPAPHPRSFSPAPHPRSFSPAPHPREHTHSISRWNVFEPQIVSEDYVDAETCSICLSSVQKGETGVLTCCGHWFHLDHLKQYANTTNNFTCPMCKTLLSK